MACCKKSKRVTSKLQYIQVVFMILHGVLHYFLKFSSLKVRGGGQGQGPSLRTTYVAAHCRPLRDSVPLAQLANPSYSLMTRSLYSPFDVDPASSSPDDDAAVLVDSEQVAEPLSRRCTPQTLCTAGLALGACVFAAVGVVLLLLFVGYPGSQTIAAAPSSSPTYAPT